MESLTRILTETGIPSRQLAIETIEFPLDLTWEMAEALDLSICLDVGHVLSGFSGTDDLYGTLELVAPRLTEIHLHDAERPASLARIVYGRDHQPLGAGDLEVGTFLDRLVEIGFDGPVIFELKVGEALRSLEVVRRIRPELV